MGIRFVRRLSEGDELSKGDRAGAGRRSSQNDPRKRRRPAWRVIIGDSIDYSSLLLAKIMMNLRSSNIEINAAAT